MVYWTCTHPVLLLCCRLEPLRCSQCKFNHYCGRKCQVRWRLWCSHFECIHMYVYDSGCLHTQQEDWPMHKGECPGMAAIHPQLPSDTMRFVLRLLAKTKPEKVRPYMRCYRVHWLHSTVLNPLHMLAIPSWSRRRTRYSCFCLQNGSCWLCPLYMYLKCHAILISIFLEYCFIHKIYQN